MKCAVLYYSETGNTKKLADSAYSAIETSDKVIFDLDEMNTLPEADLYFVGFPVYNQSYRIKIIECIEQIKDSKLALFVTCGLNPTEKYISKLEDSITVWLDDSVEYHGMLACQCKTSNQQKEKFCQINANYLEQFKEMFQRTDSHPDETDFERINEFVQLIERECTE